MAKLSKAQQEVLDLMANGWELGSSNSMTGRTWLQKDGVGRGGTTKTVNVGTFVVLAAKGLIVKEGPHFPVQKYVLPEPNQPTP